ncbi:MAG: hypothetical protein ABSE42_06645 [Bryobacteraceae bacterium]|jgi:hypothetical protein
MGSELVKIPFEGETVDAEDVTFDASGPMQCSFRLADGTTINLEHAIKKIYRLCDKKKEDGSPIYMLMGQTAIAIVKTPDQTNAKG